MRILLCCGLLVLLGVACKERRQEEVPAPTLSDDGERQTAPGVKAQAQDDAVEEAAPPKIKVRPPKPERPKEAELVAGRPGYVIAPMSGKEVFVGGIPAGSTVRDPEFPDDESGYFLVPEMPAEQGAVPFGNSVPGKEGFVFSPFNNKIVDVTGIPGGTLVADPSYTAGEKKYFRVPASADLLVAPPDR